MRTFINQLNKCIWLLGLVFLLLACSLGEDPRENAAVDPPENILRMDVDFDFGPFNPTCADCSGSTHVFPLIYSYLCVPNPEGGLEPDLAVSWEYDPNTFTWQIRLRKDARFHNGNSVTVDDVIFSIMAWRENREKRLDYNIKHIKAKERDVLEIQLKQNDPDFLYGIWDLEIIPDLASNENLDLNDFPVGSGPFKFSGRGDDGRVIVSANDTYYNGRPAIDTVVFYHIPDREKSWTRLIRGETDIVGNLSAKNYQMIQQYADRFYFSKYVYNYYSILLYNTHLPLFENPVVRQALTHAINREAIVSDILNGMAEVVAGPMGSQSKWHDPDLHPLAYDPYLALDYLKKAGWVLDPDTKYLVNNGQEFAFEMLYPAGSKTDERVARFIKLNLNEIGIKARTRALPLDDLYKLYRQNTKFEAVLIDLNVNARRPENALTHWTTHNMAISGAGGFDSPEADRLASQIGNTSDSAMKKALFQQFDRLIADLQPGSFLFRKLSIDAMSRRFALKYPFSFDHQGFYRLQHARLKKERQQ